MEIKVKTRPEPNARIFQIDLATEVAPDGTPPTAGPWSVWSEIGDDSEPTGEGRMEAPFGVCHAETGAMLAQMWFGEHLGVVTSRSEALSNALLMASATDLLAALREMVDASDAYDESDASEERVGFAIDGARVLISKISEAA